MELAHEEQEQYSRHLLLDEIGISGQLKLKNASVLVIGAGGLGCPTLQYLSAAGVGTIGIVDDDVVEKSNLQRQILFTQHDIGQKKATVAASRLQAVNPHVHFEIYPQRLSVGNAISIFENYDIIVDGTDNFSTRYLINDAAVLANKPVVFGSIYKFSGQVTVFNYKQGPTYRCLYPNPPKPDAMPNCSEVGVLGVLPGIIGSLQANEVLKMILEIGTVLSGRLLTFDALSMKQNLLTFEKNHEIYIASLAADYEGFCGIPKEVVELSLEAYKANGADFNVLDVRTFLEREAIQLDSIHIPLDELEERWTELAVDKSLLVFCKSGMRSKKAIAILREKGFKRAMVNLKNGLG
ncbi:molybdopterin-synthase adenylyltransferase MoeB [Flavobacterium antarcticum]|uniref:molybdopterin-synthase adenylyltransferase MoeB n=1 Tax=Flavobacterium antarcticum TaxID=271155 RepID=UPI0003B38F37|nr:molybdopterin-synthase adenylyltransferase MoeB [Flavobacterium antarcticum]